MSSLKAIQTLLEGHMINRILNSWSFLAEGSFDTLHIK